MDANEYQKLASRTLIEKPDQPLTDLETMIVWNLIGLCGEAGELAEMIKHRIFHRHENGEIDIENLMEELGDLLWYVAAICTETGVSLEKVMEFNITKLKKRYPNGYNIEDSIKRADKIAAGLK